MDWAEHFESVAAVNEWQDEEKLLWLRVRLVGRAVTAYKRVLEGARASYAWCLEALKEWFDPSSKRELYLVELLGRKKIRSEDWATFRRGSEAAGGACCRRTRGISSPSLTSWDSWNISNLPSASLIPSPTSRSHFITGTKDGSGSYLHISWHLKVQSLTLEMAWELRSCAFCAESVTMARRDEGTIC